jgi:phosphohistidine phosphatase SixA
MKKQHRTLRRRPIFLPLLAPVFGGIVAVLALLWLWHANEITTVMIVRHADIEEGSEPLQLSSTGIYRAKALGGWLSESGLDRIYVSDFGPAQETAQAVAKATGAEVVDAPGGDVRGLARRLGRLQGETVLVVTRREILPELVEGLGGFRPEIAEADYSDLFMVTDSILTRARTVVLKYGG